MKSAERKKTADYFLYQCGLLDELKKYGVPHIIGSYPMDLMAWNDLDIDIENENMSLDQLYHLTGYIINTFHPTWYEAKEEVTADGKTVWFQGFETRMAGELWNFDLWFFDRETIRHAEDYCHGIMEKVNQFPELRKIIVNIKEALIARNLYSFEQYTSLDVYRAVLEENIRNVDDFLKKYSS